MRFVPNVVSSTVARQALHFQKHSPAIMFGAGISLAVVAAIKACQATLKVEEVVKEAEKTRAELQTVNTNRPTVYTVEKLRQDERLVRVHLARDLTKLYAPAVFLGAGSIALLTGAHVVLTKRNVALTAAYVGLDRVFNEYRSRVKEELGEDKDREFRYGVRDQEVVKETKNGHEIKTVKRVGEPGKRSQYAVLFDQGNKNWQPQAEYNRTFIMLQQVWANERLRAKGHLFLNDVYEALGMEPTPAGQIVGWVVGGNMKTTAGDGYVDFGLFNPKTQEIYDFMQGEEGSVWLDFNVDGPVWDLI